MSALPTSIRPDPYAVQCHLNRLHLLYQFDLRQRIWVLQALEIRGGLNSTFPAGFAALASAIAKNTSDFSDPTREVTPPQRPPAAGRESGGCSSGFFADNPKTKKGKMKIKNYSLAAIAAAAIGSL